MSSVQTYQIDPSEELDHKVTDKMRHLLRNKRELEKIGSSMKEREPCSVKNMTCIKFPSKNHCKGIAVGRCVSRTDLLVKLFTPDIVTVTIFSVVVIIIVILGLSQHCYKLKTEYRVEPSEEEYEEAPKNGAIKTQVCRTSFGWISPSCMKVAKGEYYYD